MIMELNRCAVVFGSSRRRRREEELIDDACEAKNEYMIRNGALLLQKQIAAGHGKGSASDPVRIFSIREIQKATDNYDHRLILGRNVAIGYKGTLEDGRVVAIKSPRGLPPTDSIIDFFLNQVVIKQIINHRNVGKLHGCCLETRVPTLVYEFYASGTLSDQIHGNIGFSPYSIPWPELVRIAAETSHALSYMHIALPKPVIHMDVKPSNIYLDESFNAKLTNFGFSVSISPGEDFVSHETVGSFGYIDPEYQVTHRVTEKCDIYSFGVTLVELLTGKDPMIMVARARYCSLVDFFRCCLEQDAVPEIVHPRVMREAAIEEIQALAGLALRCIAGRGEERPTMREVAIELRQIHLAAKRRQR